MDRLDSEYKEAEQRLEAKYEQEQKRLNKELAGFQAKWDAEKAGLIEDYEAKLQNAKLEKERDLRNAKLEKERDLRNIKAEKERLKVALVKRDHFNAMTDLQLSTRFQDLAGEIDQTARVRWDATKEGEWPWPQHILLKSKNERKLKHDIIQSQIWVILSVFCILHSFSGSWRRGQIAGKAVG